MSISQAASIEVTSTLALDIGVPCALPTACLTIPPPDTGVFGCTVSLGALDLLRPSADGVDVGENEAALVAEDAVFSSVKGTA